MYFDEEDIKFSRNLPDDTPPDGLTDCTDMNNTLLQLVELVGAVDCSIPNAEIEFCSAVSNLLYQDGSQLTEDNAMAVLVAQVFVISTVLKAFDEESKLDFLEHLEIMYAFADDTFFAPLDICDRGDNPIDTQEMNQKLLEILRECDFSDSGSRLEMMLHTMNLAAVKDGGTDELLHAELMALLNFTIINLLKGIDDESRIRIIEIVREAALEVAQEAWVPYHDSPSTVTEEDSGEESAPMARRVTFSMCFDSATMDEAIAIFVKSAESILASENLDAVLKVETFEEPLNHPYVIGKSVQTRFFDVDNNKTVLREVLNIDED
jgi:hypothetical protein